MSSIKLRSLVVPVFSRSVRDRATAFSLIELSIVLIIIGLLIGGVVGGKNLIESAQIQKSIREVRTLKTAFYNFYEMTNGNLPGDENGDGCIGAVRKSECTPDKEVKFNDEYVVVGPQYGVFVDLYIKKLYNFKPDPNKVKANDGQSSGVNLPEFPLQYISYGGSNRGNSTFQPFYTVSENHYNNYNTSYSWYKIYGVIAYVGDAKGMKATIVESFDRKIDDGIYNTGEVRGDCTEKNNTNTEYTSYIKAKDGGKCYNFTFKVMN